MVVVTYPTLPTISHGTVKILRIHSFGKKYSVFPSITPLLALELQAGPVYLSLFRGF